MTLRVFTPSDFAAHVNLSERTVVELCAAGRIPGVAKLGRRWRIPETAKVTPGARENIRAVYASLDLTSPDEVSSRLGIPADPERRRSVYFIEAIGAGVVKIGYARSPEARLIAIRCDNHCEVQVVLLASGNEDAEGMLHRRFASLRLRGEWFRLEGSLAKTIARVRGKVSPRTLHAWAGMAGGSKS